MSVASSADKFAAFRLINLLRNSEKHAMKVQHVLGKQFSWRAKPGKRELPCWQMFGVPKVWCWSFVKAAIAPHRAPCAKLQVMSRYPTGRPKSLRTLGDPE